MKLDLVFTGVGGQGVVVLSDIFLRGGFAGWLYCESGESRMAQRGGSISAHVRVGDKVLSPLIERVKVT